MIMNGDCLATVIDFGQVNVRCWFGLVTGLLLLVVGARLTTSVMLFLGRGDKWKSTRESSTAPVGLLHKGTFPTSYNCTVFIIIIIICTFLYRCMQSV